MNTGCEFYGDALVELVRGTLDPERTRRVELHLETCPDCRDALEVVQAVRSSTAEAPSGLESRIRDAVRAAARERVVVREPRIAPVGERHWWQDRRGWAVPVAAVAALLLWIGGQLASPGQPVEGGQEAEAAAYDPYGTWPASDAVVAGDVVLSELSEEELEALLEEMQS